MEIVKLITKIIEKAVARNIKFFCNECEKEIIISDLLHPYLLWILSNILHNSNLSSLKISCVDFWFNITSPIEA